MVPTPHPLILLKSMGNSRRLIHKNFLQITSTRSLIAKLQQNKSIECGLRKIRSLSSIALLINDLFFDLIKLILRAGSGLPKFCPVMLLYRLRLLRSFLYTLSISFPFSISSSNSPYALHTYATNTFTNLPPSS